MQGPRKNRCLDSVVAREQHDRLWSHVSSREISMNTFFRACAVTLAVVAVVLSGAVAAQDFPNKPIRLIIPYPAGGATDLTSRAFVSVAEEHLGQPMIVQIRTGGGGVVGAESALKSKPDGYTLFVGDPATHIILPNVQKVPYDPA